MPWHRVELPGGGGPVEPTMMFREIPRARDPFSIKPVFVERSTVLDGLLLAPVVTERPMARDRWSITMEQMFRETPKVRDTGLMRAQNLHMIRSGTPDADWQGDAWTDAQTLPTVQTGVNHGNEALQIVNLATGAKRGFMKWNLGTVLGFGGTTSWEGRPSTSSATLSIVASLVSGLVPVTLTFTYASASSNPFTESTLTHANAPAISGGVKTIELNGAGAQSFSLFFTAGEVNLMTLLPWFWCIITSSSLIDTATLQSREAATASERPQWAFDLKNL